MGTLALWGLILAMTAVTFMTRFLPLAILSRVRLPAWLTRWLELIPAAVIAAMLAPAVFFNGDKLDLSAGNPSFWAAIPAALVAWRTRSLILTILTGMVASALMQQAF
jgi:branched-subunit amino acid transport protein